MKRLFISIISAALFLCAQAGEFTTAYVLCADGSAQSYEIESLTDITFSADNSYIYLNAADGIKVTYPISYLESICFEEPSAKEPQTYTTDFDVAIDPADDTSYSYVTETVTMTETATNDYGDFIENFIEDEEAKGTVTVTYSGTTASFTYNPSSLKNNVVAVSSGTSSDVVAYATKKVRFILTGNTSDGSFKLYAAKKVRLTLNNVSIANSDGGAIVLPKVMVGATEYGGKTAYVEIADGTTNTLTDGTSYTYTTGEDMKGVLFSEGQLIFSGNGTLNVNANFGHGIASDDYVRIRGGKHNPVINITTASKDGIKVHDYVLMNGGTVSINTADDGVDVSSGYIEMNAGKLTVNAVDEAVTTSYEEADASITPNISVRGGLLKLTTTGEKAGALKSAGSFTQTGGIVQATVKGNGSKALDTEGSIVLMGGKFVAFAEGTPVYDSEEKDLKSSACVRCKGSMSLSGATVELKATGDGAKGINNVGTVNVTGGTITVVASGSRFTDSVSGEKSRARGVTSDVAINMSKGTLRVRATDDAVYTPLSLTFSGGALHAFSSEGQSIQAASVEHTAGWLVTK